MSSTSQRMAENLAHVREQMANAARASGRQIDDVQLVAVAKYLDIANTTLLHQAGANVLGESRPQQLWEKTEAAPLKNVEWHMIGHLQRNKVRRTLPLIQLLHSGDSSRLLNEVERTAARPCEVLLEVNTSGEETKHGFSPEELPSILELSSTWKKVRVRGLMTMAPRASIEHAHRCFARLKELQTDHLGKLPMGHSLEELSMGMSGDFVVAIEEGATIVRVGSALLEGLS